MLLALSLAVALQAAAAPIRGTIVEARTGAPLEGVLVRVQGTGQESITGADGRFEIGDVPEGPQALLVSVVGYALVQRNVVVSRDVALDVTIAVAEGAITYVEEVTVGAPAFRQSEPGVASQSVLGSRDLLNLRGVIADDPFRAVQALPEVATGDDFRAEFAVRGLGPEHTGIAIDGIDTPLLFHTVRGVTDTGSLALINTDILESAALLAGAYPQRDGAHLGARLDFTTRDGARDGLHARVLVSGAAATTVWEGPIAGGRGAWLAAFRQSYLDWLLEQVDPDAEGTFGFTDGQAKLTFDLTDRQRLRVSVIAGRSLFTENDPSPGPNTLDTAHNRTVISSVQWRYTPSPLWLLTQQIFTVSARYRNVTSNGGVREEGGDRDIVWRGSVQRALGARHVLELGGRAGHHRAERLDRTFTSRGSVTTLDADARAGTVAMWAHDRWAPTPSVVVSPGVRVDRFGLIQQTVVSPWLLAEWQVTPSWRVRASGGAQHQAPTFDQGFLARPGTTLDAERAATVDAGLERQLGDAWRVRVDGYSRRESDRLRFVNSEARLVGDTIVRPIAPYWANTLNGSAYGGVFSLERRHTSGLSGWISYAYGRTELTDQSTAESYSSDYDQTHTVNAYGFYRTSGRLSLSGRFRYGSNFPLAGYYEPLAGELYALGPTRNTTRLPAYARLDVRADWAFPYRRSRLTLFVEVLNVLGRDNRGPDDPSINFTTGVVRRATQSLFPLLPSAGLLVEF